MLAEHICLFDLTLMLLQPEKSFTRCMNNYSAQIFMKLVSVQGLIILIAVQKKYLLVVFVDIFGETR